MLGKILQIVQLGLVASFYIPIGIGIWLVLMERERMLEKVRMMAFSFTGLPDHHILDGRPDRVVYLGRAIGVCFILLGLAMGFFGITSVLGVWDHA